MIYELLRDIADSYGLIFMGICFLVLVGWAFRRNSAVHNERARTMIFEQEDRDHG